MDVEVNQDLPCSTDRQVRTHRMNRWEIGRFLPGPLQYQSASQFARHVFVINYRDSQRGAVKDVLEIDYAPFYYGVPVPKSELTKLLADAVLFQAFNAYFSRRDAHRRAVAVAWSAGDRDGS